MTRIAVVGAGLAGSECAYILAEKYGFDVVLCEMKSVKMTPAQSEPHHFAELVCSNSLKSKSFLQPAGLLKEEMEQLGSLIVPQAKSSCVPAGDALAVDRELFSGGITKVLRNHPRITIREKVIPSIEVLFSEEKVDFAVIATGPLTEDLLAEDLRRLTGSEALYFYDAIAPILDGDSVDPEVAYLANRQSRFGKKNPTEEKVDEEEAEGDYLNIPLSKEEYTTFVEQLIAADKVPFHEFEEPRFFNGCQPIEVLAQSGPMTLSFGPMRPKGLINPKTGREPYAAIQLRREKLGDASYNMVGFQTRMTWTAQKAIFKSLPGMANAEFFRMGSMHRNTYLVSPRLLQPDFMLQCDPRVALAGQIMGVEGYLESAAMGLWIGHVLGQRLKNDKMIALPPPTTAIGSLARYVLKGDAKHFTPMNVHWGLVDELSETDVQKFGAELVKGNRKKLDKSIKRAILAARAQHDFEKWKANNAIDAEGSPR
jgi:methylenetetrahydrofolate--tRNA-(uracil-5-)-methyltransferase